MPFLQVPSSHIHDLLWADNWEPVFMCAAAQPSPLLFVEFVQLAPGAKDRAFHLCQ